jgi:Protein of unknown function (DUF1570)
MKRWLLAVAVLLGGVVSYAHADYIVLIVNLAAAKSEQPGKPGQPGQPGLPGYPGTKPPGGGAIGVGGGFGATGGPTLPPPPMGNYGGGGAMGNLGGGATGNIGGGALGNLGIPPGMGGGGDVTGIDLSPVIVTAVIETIGPLDANTRASLRLGRPTVIKHKYGTTVYAVDPALSMFKMVPLTIAENRDLPSIHTEYQKLFAEAHKEKIPDATKLLGLAEWCLGHGLLPEFGKVMDEVAQADKDNPKVKAYLKVKADLEKAPAENKKVAEWKGTLGFADTYRTADKGHYSLVHGEAKNEAQDVQNRLDRLENNLKSFYYWFALHEKALPVPAERLAAFMITDPEHFKRTQQLLDADDSSTDGFVALRDNLLVVSKSRVDQQYVDLEGWLKPKMQEAKASEKELLAGRENVVLQNGLLMLRALQDEGENAVISQEGSRQLLAAAGLLPRNVLVPEWVQFGMGSFFETPKGSPYTTLGLPGATFDERYNYLNYYQAALKQKKLDAPKVALEKTITDQYQKAAKDATDPAVQLKARAMSWALCYYLAKGPGNVDLLLRYYQELGKLPRDLEFDDDVLKGCFARAFGLADAKDPTKVDPVAFDRFAQKWQTFMNGEPLELKDVLDEVKKAQTDLKKAGSGTTTPGGGPMGPPGGGIVPPGGGGGGPRD